MALGTGDNLMPKVIIEDSNTGIAYTASSKKECRDSIDEIVYQLVCEHDVVIFLGKIIGTPFQEDGPISPSCPRVIIDIPNRRKKA